MHDDDLIALLDGLAPHAMEAAGTPGLNIALARRGKVIWESAYGFADLKQRTPMAVDTVTQAGSMTKMMVAVAVLQLVEQGRLDLYAPVNTFLDFKIANPLGERDITLYDLLTFRSGITTDTNYGSLVVPTQTLGEFLPGELADPASPGYDRHLRRWLNKVGHQFEYANIAFGVAARAVELRNGEGLSFGEYCLRNIVKPLGMTSTVLPEVQTEEVVGADIWARRSVGYARFSSDDFIPCPLVHSPIPGAVGLLTTPTDFIKLMLMLQGEGQLNGERLLQPESARMMRAVHVDMGIPELDSEANGLPYELGDVGTVVEHYGRIGVHTFGWLNLARVYPNVDMAVVICTNRWDLSRWFNPDETNAAGLLARTAAQALAYPRVGVAPEFRPRRWAESYAAGQAMAERLAGLLDIPDDQVRDAVPWMIENAPDGDEPWVAEAFREGAHDLLDGGTSVEEIRALIRSNAMGLPREQLEAVWMGFSGRARVPLPQAHWGNATHVAQPPTAG